MSDADVETLKEVVPVIGSAEAAARMRGSGGPQDA